LQQKVSYDALGDPYELSNPHAMAMEIESRKSSETLAGKSSVYQFSFFLMYSTLL
jgi:hypothetical protein